MNTITIHVSHETLTAQVQRPLVAQSTGITCFTAQFDDSWDGYVKTIVFTAGNFFEKHSKAVLYTGGEMLVPWEVLNEPGELWISASGVADGVLQPTALMREGLTIAPCGETTGEAPGEASPEIWQQVLEEVGVIRSLTENIQVNTEAAGSAASTASEAAASCAADRAAAEAASASAVAAAEDAQSRGFFSLKVNGSTMPVVGGAVDIAVPDEQTVAEMVETALEEGKAVTVTLRAADWYGTDTFGQTVLVTGMTEAWNPGAPVLVSTGARETDLAAQEAFSCVSTVESAPGRLKFVCYNKKPEVNVTVCIPGTFQ